MARAADVLLVEDSREDAELLLHVLRALPRKVIVHVVHDGAEALDYLYGEREKRSGEKGEMPQAMILDLRLPRVSGVEVLRRLKSDPAKRCMPVIVLTSSREERDLAECYALGANSYVVKPVDFDQFSDVVQAIGRYWTEVNEAPSRAA